MLVLLTGAFGMVGQATLNALLDQGDQVRCMDLPGRRNRKAARHLPPGCSVVWGDIRQPAAVDTALEGVAAVVHLAALIPPAADHQPDLARSVNLGGTLNLIQRLLRLAKPPRLVFASSIAVYGDRLDSPWISVHDPLQASSGDTYGGLKIQAEAAIRESGLEFVILRLSYIAGRQRLVFDPIMFRMPLGTRIEPCLVEDAGLAFARAVRSPEAAGRTFNIAGGERCRTIFHAHLDRMFGILGIGRLKDRLRPLFARRGYHCGWIIPEDEQRILAFQHQDMEDYYRKVRQDSRLAGFLARLARPLVWFMLEKTGRSVPPAGA